MQMLVGEFRWRCSCDIFSGSLGAAGRTLLDGAKAKSMIDTARVRCRRGNES